METLEDLKAIIANAPDGKTMIAESGWCLNDDDAANLAISGGSVQGVIRSLSDIERIIELTECLKSIEQTVDGGDVLGCWDMMKIRDCLK